MGCDGCEKRRKIMMKYMKIAAERAAKIIGLKKGEDHGTANERNEYENADARISIDELDISNNESSECTSETDEHY